MSATVEQPPAAPPTAGPTAGGLLRAEAHRFRSRRFIQVLLGLAVLGWLAAVVIGLLNVGVPDAADYAEARQLIEQEVTVQEGFRQDCLEQTGGFEDQCGQPIRAEDFDVDDFLPRAPFDFAAAGSGGAAGFGGTAAVVAFLIGATWIGAEWSTRSLVALLFWVPRRMQVMGAKLVVLAVASALFGVAVQLAWLAMAGILRAVASSDNPLPDGFWGDLLGTQARSVLLVVLVALIGFGLANLTRNTGAALGVGFVYFAILETAIRIFRPTWEPWLLSNNAVGLIAPGGISVFVPSGDVGPTGIGAEEYMISNLQAGSYLALVTAVVVGLGVVLFAKRDIH